MTQVFEDDPFGGIKNEKGPPSVDPRTTAAIHARDDVDSSQTAHHHTLGIKHDQAAAGDHVHDGKSTRKIGAGLGLTVTGTKNTVASEDSIISMLAQVIDFTDGRIP